MSALSARSPEDLALGETSLGTELSSIEVDW